MKTEYTPVDEEQIPPGELAVYRGARVEATDGKVDTLGEFLVNPLTGHISRLILMEGHLWGKKEVSIPVSAIDRIEEDTVYLKLEKKPLNRCLRSLFGGTGNLKPKMSCGIGP